jgi:hypothetical protein
MCAFVNTVVHFLIDVSSVFSTQRFSKESLSLTPLTKLT